MTFWVSVPISSVQAMEALAIVSQELRMWTRRFLAVIRFVVKVRAGITASGRLSGTTTTTSVTENDQDVCEGNSRGDGGETLTRWVPQCLSARRCECTRRALLGGGGGSRDGSWNRGGTFLTGAGLVSSDGGEVLGRLVEQFLRSPPHQRDRTSAGLDTVFKNQSCVCSEMVSGWCYHHCKYHHVYHGSQ